MGGEITASGSHLLDSPSNKLAQADERPLRQGWRVQVVPGSQEKGGPPGLECPPYPFLQGGVAVVHQGLGPVGGGRTDNVRVDHGYPT